MIRDRSFAKLMIWLSRVEEEKAINRALNGSGIPVPTSNNSNMDSNRQKSPPPAPVSRCCTEARRLSFDGILRIPKFSAKLGANYRRVQVFFTHYIFSFSH